MKEKGSIKYIFDLMKGTFVKFSPNYQLKHSVLFVLYLCGWIALFNSLSHWHSPSFWFDFWIFMCIFATLFVSNLAETIAENQCNGAFHFITKEIEGIKARLLQDGKEFKQAAERLKQGDLVVCEAGDVIPADGEIIEGIATIDESAITGESAPVIRESSGDRSSVTAGSKVLGDRIVIRVSAKGGESLIERICAQNNGSHRTKTTIETTLNILLFSLAAIFAITMVCFFLMNRQIPLSFSFAVGIYVCLIPSAICPLISAASMACLNRLCAKNLIVKNAQAIETAGNIDLLFLDKTGTITLGNREAVNFIPAKGYTDLQLAEIAQLASIPDETPEGRSIVILAKNKYGLRVKPLERKEVRPIPFSAKSKISGVDYYNSQGHITFSVRKGAIDAIQDYVEELGGSFPSELKHAIDHIVHQGGTPLAVTEFNKVIGVVHLKDMIKGRTKERCFDLRRMGIRTVMITGDNPQTAAAIAAEAGVDDFVAEATPEIKLNLIKNGQSDGKSVAMTGDGVSDAPALAQADVGLAMNTGAQSIREASNMIDLDSNPTKIIEGIIVGKQQLMTWGVLTIASLASLAAKFTALVPVFFFQFSTAGSLFQSFNLMNLHSAKTAILSCNIFNILFILTLIPIALNGVNYKRCDANKLFRINLIHYGAISLVFPFFAIKLIDTLLSAAGLG